MHNNNKTHFLATLILCIFCFTLNASTPSVFVGAKQDAEYIDISISWPSNPKFDYEEKGGATHLRFSEPAELLTDQVSKFIPDTSTVIEQKTTILVLPNTKIESASTTENVIRLKIKLLPKPKPQVEKKDYPDLDIQKLVEKIATHFKTKKPPKPLSKVTLDQNGDILLRYPNAPIAVYLLQNKIHIVVKSEEDPRLDLNESSNITYRKLHEGFVITVSEQNPDKPYSVEKSSLGCKVFQQSHLPTANSPRFLGEGEGDKLHLLRACLHS